MDKIYVFFDEKVMRWSRMFVKASIEFTLDSNGGAIEYASGGIFGYTSVVNF